MVKKTFYSFEELERYINTLTERQQMTVEFQMVIDSCQMERWILTHN